MRDASVRALLEKQNHCDLLKGLLLTLGNHGTWLSSLCVNMSLTPVSEAAA